MNIHEETLKIARNLIKKDPSLTDWVISKFPELKESEESGDERIRKNIINFLQETIDNVGESPNIWTRNNAKKWIAWLEKQGEHANFLSKIQVGDKVTRNEAGVLVNLSQLDRVAKPRSSKPADKVESMFKGGDIITNGKIIGKVDENDNNKYHGWFGYDKNLSVHYSDIPDIENWHKWTVADAKDGDVLSDGTTIFIFEDLLSDCSVMSYCDYDADSGESDAFCPLSVNLMCSKITPATKEQRDALMKAMANAGYTFDFEKKELKKIEPTDKYEGLTDFERTLADICIGWIGEEIGWKEYIKDNADVLLKIAIKKFNSIQDAPFEQRSAWSEEDKNMLQSILDEYKSMPIEKRNWLKSLKDRVQPQNKWKPSGEQIDALEHFVRSIGESGYASPYDNNTKLLYSLLSDLKELKG